MLDALDNVIGEEEYLLSSATAISIEDAPAIVKEFGGVCFPAHIDRESNGVIATLGTFPETPHFDAVEFRDKENVEDYVERYNLSDKIVLVDSDAHYLEGIKDKEHYLDLDCDEDDADSVRRQLFRYFDCDS